MKRYAILKATSLLLPLLLLLSACTVTPQTPGESTTSGTECRIHTDADGDGRCDNCSEGVKTPEIPDCTEHKDADGDGMCDDCGADINDPETSDIGSDTSESTQESTAESTDSDTSESTQESTAESTDSDTSESTQESTAESTDSDTSESTQESTAESTDSDTSESTQESTAESTESDTSETTGPDSDQEYTITFWSQGSIVGVLKVKNGDAFAVPALDRGQEYILLGWKDADTGEYISETVFTKDENVSLVAVWDTVWSDGY